MNIVKWDLREQEAYGEGYEMGKTDASTAMVGDIIALKQQIERLERRLEAAERRLGHELTRLRVAVCECGKRPDPLDVPLDNEPQHHDFSCPYRTGAPGGLPDTAAGEGCGTSGSILNEMRKPHPNQAAIDTESVRILRESQP